MTRRFKLTLGAALLVALALAGRGAAAAEETSSSVAPRLFALQQAAAPQPAPEGFEPVSRLPPVQREQLPAAPLVMAAYAFVWAMLLGYLWSIWRRLGAVEREMQGLASRVEEAGRRR